MKSARLSVLIFLLLPISLSYAGSFRSVTSDSLVEAPNGKSYREAEVRCSGNKRVIIQRDAMIRKWCAKDIEGFCDRSKVEAAKKVCGSKYSKALASQVTVIKNNATVAVEAPSQSAAAENQTSNEDLEQETITPPVETPKAPVAAQEQDQTAIQAEKEALLLEERRLKVDQQRLELRKQELELQRQEFELTREIKAEAAKQARLSKPKPALAPKAAPVKQEVKPVEQKKESSVPLMFRTQN